MTVQADTIEITNCPKKLDVRCADLSGSTFVDVNAASFHFENINLSDTQIKDANLSRLEIDGAQLGGAYIHNIGLLPADHPGYDPNHTRQAPVRFENCDLNSSSFTDCDLSGVQLNQCKLTGLTIDGIPVEDLLRAYAAARQEE